MATKKKTTTSESNSLCDQLEELKELMADVEKKFAALGNGIAAATEKLNGMSELCPIPDIDDDEEEDEDEIDDELPEIDPSDPSNYEHIYTIEEADTAKQLAYIENRPLLIIVGEKTCSSCRTLAEKVLETATFKKYLRNNHIVCLELLSAKFSSRGKSEFRKAYKNPIPNINGEPWLMLVRVTSDDLLGSKPENFYPDQVQVVKVKKTSAWYIGSYDNRFESVTGINPGGKSDWTVAKFVKQIEAGFPNDVWKSL